MPIHRWIPVLLTTLLVLPAASMAGPESFAEGMARARAEGKPMLLDLWATWCGPCKVFNRDSAEDSDVMELLESFVVVKIDAEKGEGIELAERFSLSTLPTYVVLDDRARVLHQWTGYYKPEFLAEANKVLADPTTIEEKMARFAETPTLEDALTLASYHFGVGSYGEAWDMYRSAAGLDPENDYAFDQVTCAYYGYRNDVIEEGRMTDAARDFLADEASPADEVLTVASFMNGAFRSEPDKAAPFLRTAVERTEGNEDEAVLAQRKRLLPDYALHVLGDKDKAVQYKRASYPEGWDENPNYLNGFAWWCFENDVNLEEAQEMAMKGVSLAEPGPDRAMILDTLAEICNARGNCGEAVDHMLQAVEDDPGNERYMEQVERFRTLLAEQEEGD